MYIGSLVLNQAMCEIMWSGIMCPYNTSHLKPSLLAAFQVDGPEWSTQRRFHCGHIWEQMLDDVHAHLSFIFLQ
jgi:hypothetical protein